MLDHISDIEVWQGHIWFLKLQFSGVFSPRSVFNTVCGGACSHQKNNSPHYWGPPLCGRHAAKCFVYTMPFKSHQWLHCVLQVDKRMELEPRRAWKRKAGKKDSWCFCFNFFFYPVLLLSLCQWLTRPKYYLSFLTVITLQGSLFYVSLKCITK